MRTSPVDHSTTLTRVVTLLAALAVLGASGIHPSPVAAQDGFGAAVAVTGPDEVVVLKPGAAIGPAVAVVYRRGADGSWTQTNRLSKLPGGFPGEALMPELSVGGDLLLIGSGDPGGREAGHAYRRAGGEWTAVARVPVDPAAPGPGASLPAGGLDMATLSRLMGPPVRRSALSPDGSRLAVTGGALPPGTVHVLVRDGDGWTLEGVVTARPSSDAEAPEPVSTGFGAALALATDRLVVGAPREGAGGAVHVFDFDGTEWSHSTALRTDSLRADGLLGSALSISPRGIELFAAAPGRNRVARYLRSDDGRWLRAEDVAPPSTRQGEVQGFGASIALDGGRLVVGDPFDADGQGRAHVYERLGNGWSRSVTLTPGELDRAAFGTSVALRGSRAVVGAPGAFGASGRAAVVDLDAPGALVWLEGGSELTAVSGGEPVRCADGEAAGFECDAVDLVSFLPLSALGAEAGEGVTDVWGWTDPQSGREYVLVGRTAGLAFVDITSAGSPRFLGLMPANPSHARDIKVYRDHAFFTGDGAGDHGLLVFDLTRLRGLDASPIGEGARTFEPDARYDLVASAHNLVIDTESGFAYTVGTNTGAESCGGGLHMIDIRDPLQPAFAGCYTDTEGLIWNGRTHDAQCTVYRGPDEAYQGRQICLAANETAMRIVDVTDKSAPAPISTASHPGAAYVHQGWLTEDHRYLYVNDELDEIVGTTDRTRTLIYDVAELDDPILIGEHLGPDQATDHNLYISGTRAYLANYQAGFRVLDIADPENPVEIGWFDTTPYGENPPGFGGGAWTAWPFFESGMVVVTSMNEGLFIVRPQRPVT